jgi:hypothetical protein
MYWAPVFLLPALRTETLLIASKEVRLEVHTKKTKCIFSTGTGENCIMKSFMVCAAHSSEMVRAFGLCSVKEMRVGLCGDA